MSDILGTDGPTGIALSRYCGPELPGGGDRQRYQLTWPDGRQVDLSVQDWLGLVALAARWIEPENAARVREAAQ